MQTIDFIPKHKSSTIVIIKTLREYGSFKIKTYTLNDKDNFVRVCFKTRVVEVNPQNRFVPNRIRVIITGRRKSEDIRRVKEAIGIWDTTLSKGIKRKLVTNSQIQGATKVDFSHDTMMDVDFFSSQTSPYSQPKTQFKEMQVTKTQEVEINGVNRELTIVVLNEGKVIKAGYSIRMPKDPFVKGLSEKIALGRANKPSTNLVDMELGKGLDKKFILHAVADNLIFKIEKGIIKIKGVKNLKID